MAVCALVSANNSVLMNLEGHCVYGGQRGEFAGAMTDEVMAKTQVVVVT